MTVETPITRFAALIENQLEVIFSDLDRLALRPAPAGSNIAFPSTVQVEKLAQYAALLETWSPKVDLIAPAPPEMIVSRHIVDSYCAVLFAWYHLEISTTAGVVDVGSGAGLPGVVFAISAPAVPVTLIEPREKRSIFLDEVRRRLGLKDLKLIRKRVEQVAPTELRPAELSVTRATGMRELFLKESRRLLSPNGFAVEMLAEAVVVEDCDKILSYRLPPDDARRVLACWRSRRLQ